MKHVIVDFNKELKKKRQDLKNVKEIKPQGWEKLRMHLEKQIKYLVRITKKESI